ncbi:hypothetical protein HPHPH45_1090 [Helicobacter pylori Hp H-45]|uniref:Uncharacterized protein n=2 Tax=Helicobacter pylori TaxID=210 RepID=I9TB39_HELPX|nr:hypothetical protein HPHPH45_1090 [Helicobacter pylori Hp H-45]
MNENGKKEALQLWLLAFEQLTKNIDIQKWDLKGLKGEFEDALLLSDGHFTEEIQVKSSGASVRGVYHAYVDCLIKTLF